jgi:hypothetical protein
MKALSGELGINLFDKAPRGLKPSGVGRVYGAGVALIQQSASRFQPPGVLFKPLTGDLCSTLRQRSSCAKIRCAR